MNYLICNHCNYKNAVYTQHFVFCNHCNKKISNNYTDWKKTNNHLAFEDYVLAETTTNAEPIFKPTIIKPNVVNRTRVFLTQKTNKEFKLFGGIVLFQLFVFAFFMQIQNNSFDEIEKQNNNDYKNVVYWETHSITNDLEIDVPFDLTEATTTLTPFMLEHVINSDTKRAESIGCFSVTIEKFEMTPEYPIPYDMLFQIKDEYMQQAHFEYTEENKLEHIPSKRYETTMRHGEYSLNANRFLFDNYTFKKGNNVVNVTVSYLKNDKDLTIFAGKISERLLQIKTS